MKHLITKRLKPLLFIILFVVTACSAVQYFDLAQRLEFIAYDWQLTLARQNKTPPADIKVILVDDDSLQAMGPIVGHWPWPRKVFADVIDFVARGKPNAIIFDIPFTEKTQQSFFGSATTRDTNLMEATKNAGMVYHKMVFMSDNKPNSAAVLPPIIVQRDAANPEWFSPSAASNQHVNNFLLPVDGLYQVAAGLGVESANKDSDGVLRRMAPFFNYQGRYYPSLSIAPLIQLDKTNNVDKSFTRQISRAPLTLQGDLLVNQYPFNSYSISAVLASKADWENGGVTKLAVNPNEFRNKYVFIGASAPLVQDLIPTPLKTNSPQVFMHASTLANFINNDFLVPPTNTVTYLSIVLLAMLTSLFVIASNRPLVQHLFPALTLAAYIVIGVWLFQHNQVLELATPGLAVVCAWALCYAFLFFSEEKAKTKIRKMFSQNLSHAALNTVVDNYENYTRADKGSRETVTVMFANIRGFTELSETLPAETVVEILNFYFDKMTEAVHKHNGTVDKFIGDTVMSMWGAPVPSENHAIDAVSAAMEMLQKLNEVNDWLAEKNYPPLKIGVGINTGDVILGNVGSELNAGYTAMGETVNLASRLETVTKQYGCEIIISESTKRALKDRIPCQVVDLIKVNEKNQATKIFSPVIAKEDASRTKVYELHCISELSHEAFSHYLNKRWDLAINAYRRIPNENLSKKFITRCESFQATPPPLDWDGTATTVSN